MDGIRRTVRTGAAPASSRLGAMNSEASVSMTSGRGTAAAKSWTPTVANLLVLVILEVLAFAALRMVINKIV